MLRFVLAALVLCSIAVVAGAWPPNGMMLPPGVYDLVQANPMPPPDLGGVLQIGPNPTQGWWLQNNDWIWRRVWWDNLKNAYELSNGDFLFMYPDGTWVRVDRFSNWLASGTYARRP